MNEQKVTTPLIKAIIISLILIVSALIIQFTTDFKTSQNLGWLQVLILVGAIIWSCIQYSNQMNNNVTFGNVFVHGFKVSAILTLIMILFTVVLIKVISPDMIDKAIDVSREKMESNKNGLSETQMDQAINITRKYFLVFAIGGVLFMDMLIGVISSLIGAAVAKKNPNPNPVG